MAHGQIVASSRGNGFAQGPLQPYFLHAEIRRLAAESDAIHKTTAQLTVFLRQQG